MVSVVHSHSNDTSRRQHLWEIDLRFALNSTPGWSASYEVPGGDPQKNQSLVAIRSNEQRNHCGQTSSETWHSLLGIRQGSGEGNGRGGGGGGDHWMVVVLSVQASSRHLPRQSKHWILHRCSCNVLKGNLCCREFLHAPPHSLPARKSWSVRFADLFSRRTQDSHALRAFFYVPPYQAPGMRSTRVHPGCSFSARAALFRHMAGSVAWCKVDDLVHAAPQRLQAKGVRSIRVQPG